MMSTNELSPTITTSEIARTLDVPTTTVSTWKRRSEGGSTPFPAPIENSTAARPLFDLDEVIAWYEKQPHGKKWPRRSESASRMATTLVADLRGALGSEPALEPLIGLVTLAAVVRDATSRGHAVWSGAPLEVIVADLRSALASDRAWMPEDVRLLLNNVPADGGPYESVVAALGVLEAGAHSEIVEDLVGDPRLTIQGSSATAGTSPALADLMIGLIDRKPQTVIDPACGTGSLVLTAAERFPEAQFTGVDISREAVAIARCRAYLRGATVTFIVADALTWVTPEASFDAVLIDPPLNYPASDDQSNRLSAIDRDLARYAASNGDLVWLTVAAHLVRRGGTAVVASPASALDRAGATENARRELVTRSQVKAIVGLPIQDRKVGLRLNDDPRRLRQDARMALSLWVLCAQGESDSIVFIDGEQFVGETSRDTASRLKDAVASGTRGQLRSGVAVAKALATVRPGRTLVPSDWLPKQDEQSLASESVADLSEAADAYRAILSPGIRPELPAIDIADTSVSTVRLDEVGRVITGKYVRPEKTHEEPAAGLIAQVGADGSRRYVDEPSSATLLLTGGDLLIDVRSGRTVIWHGAEPAVPDSSTLVIRPDETRFTPEYLAVVMRSALTVERGLRGMAKKRLDPRRIDIPVLPLERQRDVVREVSLLEELEQRLAGAAAAAAHYLESMRNLVALGVLHTDTQTTQEGTDHDR